MGREKKREGEAPQIFWRRTGAVKMIAVFVGYCKGHLAPKNTEMSQIKSYKASVLEALLYKSVNLCTEVTTWCSSLCIVFYSVRLFAGAEFAIATSKDQHRTVTRAVLHQQLLRSQRNNCQDQSYYSHTTSGYFHGARSVT